MMNKVKIYAQMAIIKLVLFLVVVSMLSQCSQHEKQKEEESKYKKELSDKLYTIRNEDSLLIILQQFSEKKDDVGKMICYKHLGCMQRTSAHFAGAISNHKKGLAIALELNDTVEIVQAMNNLGTDFRRIGAHSQASQHHYQALHYAERWSGQHTPIGIKSKSTSLNGIGNISLMLGYYNDAEKTFAKL